MSNCGQRIIGAIVEFFTATPAAPVDLELFARENTTKTEVSTTIQIIFITAVPIQTQVTAISQIQTATKSNVTLPVQNPNTKNLLAVLTADSFHPRPQLTLYLIELSSSNLLRVSAGGNGSQFGDIYNLGQYWIATGFGKENKSNWTQIDLNPYPPKFGEIANAGTTKRRENGPVRISDWVSIPSAGRVLWSLAACDPDSE
ncbi:hypothetical protein TWF106_010258 [Orbilia oligospora]|uniref:Uncharacterized protein n=1 Tax=Orbilia oligospora TaxID=2813651 RepID=A0A6G1MBQ4_ORBOL|nr:hypothetical protein TWF106_010258 [Orbilia oligospora]KAF3219204.1 hypothetical protein TWF191_007997 [Orbilia oligospora]KAF3251820.1 hypothetical protein TWF192_004778 [Orbilia oligospora]